MSKVLFIKSSPLQEEFSKSTKIAKVFLYEYLTFHPSDEVEELDLYKMDIPFIDEDVMNGWQKLSISATLSEVEAAKIALINRFTEQFIQADKFIFVSPLWNLGIPPKLKAYFDTITVAGKTFQYTEQGPKGLLKDKLAIHIHGRGSVNTGEIPEYADTYVRSLLEFIGVSVLPSIYVEGIDTQPENAEAIMGKLKEEAITAAHKFNFSLAD